MNKQRRKAIQEIFDIISEAREQLEALKEEEEIYMENIPENLQSSERYERAEEVVGEMEEVLDNLDTVLDVLEEVIQ